MATCRTCKEKFHACNNCDLIYDWEWSFCTEKCWKESEEYKKAKNLGQILAHELKRETLDLLQEVLDDSELSSIVSVAISDTLKKMKGKE